MSWNLISLGEITNIRTGKLDANASSANGEYPFFTCAREPLKISSFSYNCECVLVAGNGDLNVKYYNGKFDAYQRTYIIESKSKEVLDVRYLFHFLDKYLVKLREQSIGGIIKYIKLGNLTEAKIPLPPLAEQRRIASILDQADELRQKRQQAIEKLDQLLQATFIDMFGDPIDNLKGLETVALLDLCKKVTDGTHQSPKWTAKGSPFLFISNIVDGEIDYSSQKFIDQATYDSLTKSTKIELNDILYTTVGSYGNVARVKSDQLFCFQRHIAHIKPDFDKINPKFLEKMLSSYGVRRQADRLVRGVAQKTLNLKDLKEIIVFNISLDEQNYFVQKCEVIESLKIKSKLALNQADDLFKSLQNQAFSGNL